MKANSQLYGDAKTYFLFCLKDITVLGLKITLQILYGHTVFQDFFCFVTSLVTLK